MGVLGGVGGANFVINNISPMEGILFSDYSRKTKTTGGKKGTESTKKVGRARHQYGTRELERGLEASTKHILIEKKNGEDIFL